MGGRYVVTFGGQALPPSAYRGRRIHYVKRCRGAGRRAGEPYFVLSRRWPRRKRYRDDVRSAFSAAEEVKDKIDLSLAYDETSYYEAGENGKYRFSALDVNEIAKSRLDTIAEFISESIAQSGFECNAHCPVYLTGNGVTTIRGAKEYLSQVLKKPIEIIAPDVPCYNKPKFSSTIALLDVASDLNAQELTGLNKILQNLLSKIGG